MRKCKATIWVDGKAVAVEGLFHQFANQYEDCGDAGVANYTVAIIELDDGRVVEAAPDTVEFLDIGTERPSHDELKAAAMPLLDLLNKYFDPHAYAVVTEGRVEVVRGEIGSPLPVRD